MIIVIFIILIITHCPNLGSVCLILYSSLENPYYPSTLATACYTYLKIIYMHLLLHPNYHPPVYLYRLQFYTKWKDSFSLFVMRYAILVNGKVTLTRSLLWVWHALSFTTGRKEKQLKAREGGRMDVLVVMYQYWPGGVWVTTAKTRPSKQIKM